MVVTGSWGIGIGTPGFKVFHLGENVLMYATASARFWCVSGSYWGMLVVTKPRVIASNRS